MYTSAYKRPVNWVTLVSLLVEYLLYSVAVVSLIILAAEKPYQLLSKQQLQVCDTSDCDDSLGDVHNSYSSLCLHGDTTCQRLHS